MRDDERECGAEEGTMHSVGRASGRVLFLDSSRISRGCRQKIWWRLLAGEGFVKGVPMQFRKLVEGIEAVRTGRLERREGATRKPSGPAELI